MAPRADLENNVDQEEIELNDVHNSSREARMPYTTPDNTNNSTQQSGGIPRLQIRSQGALLPRELTMPAGHPRLAELMSRRPQMGIYRRFGYLNSQNLLYMQAELMSLENKLKKLQEKDAKDTSEQASDRAGDWKKLSEAEFHSDGESLPQGASCCGHRRCEEWCCGERKPHRHCDQWNLASKISEKLQRYNDALIQQISLASAGAPDSYDLEWIQSFFASDQLGMKGALTGDDRHVWGSKENGDAREPVYDLVALVPPSKRDPFHEWISKKLVKQILNRKSWRRSVSKNRSLEEKTLIRWTTAITSAITATVPIVSVVALYFTPYTNVRLALLAVFNLLAAFVLYIFTDAQPMQVFAASAAYSAVNIVFIGSNASASG